MDFGEVLTKAWSTIWKHKVLWIFGILASCGTNSSSGGGQVNYQFSGGDYQDMPRVFERFFFQLERTLGDFPFEILPIIVAGLVCLGLFIGLIFFLLSVLGRVGLIKGTLQAEEEGEALTFSQLIQDIRPFLLRSIGLNFLIGVTLFVIFVIIGLAIFGVAIFTLGIGLLCIIPLICLLVPVFWFISIIMTQANIALIAEDLGIIQSIGRGWEIVRFNVGSVIVMGLILILGGAIVNVLIGLPLVAVLLPVMGAVFGGVIAESRLLFGGGLGAAALCLVIYLPILLVLSGIVKAYIESAWTLTFLQLSGRSEAGEEIESMDELPEPG
jgi:hypothetical protein